MLLLEKHLTGSAVPGSQLTARLVALPSSSAIRVSWPRGTKGYTPPPRTGPTAVQSTRTSQKRKEEPKWEQEQRGIKQPA